MKTFATIVAVSALAAQANAFWGTGHLLVARRAQAILESSSSPAFDTALLVLADLQASEPTLTKDEDLHPFTETAVFADNIKGQGYSAQSDWHFIDQPYFSDGGSQEDYPDFEYPAPTDTVRAMTDITAFLKGEDVSADSVYINQIKEWFSDDKDQISFALRLVIHYVGDMHQPLHSVSEVNDEYKKGDRGGNSEYFKPTIDGVSNLHSIWDSVIYEYTGYPSLPLSDDDWTWYTTTTQGLADQYPTEADKILSGEFAQWSAEGLQMAKDFVYPGFEYTVPSDEYKEKAIPALQAHMMYGGARLAALIEEIYGESSSEVTFLQ